MTRWMAAVATVVLMSVATLGADVTVIMTTTVEGAAAAAVGGAAPQMTIRVKGTKAHFETETKGTRSVFIIDLATRQILMLNPADSTARIVDASSAIVPSGTALPPMDVTFKPTGQKRTIDNIACDEYAVGLTMDMSTFAAANPEAAQSLSGMKIVMSGSSWLTTGVPGAAEYVAFQKAAVSADVVTLMAKALGGDGGLDKLLVAMAGAEGMAYLTEMTLTVEGSGQVGEMMRQLGPMKLTQKVTAVLTEPLADELFTVPSTYTIVK